MPLPRPVGARLKRLSAQLQRGFLGQYLPNVAASLTMLLIAGAGTMLLALSDAFRAFVAYVGRLLIEPQPMPPLVPLLLVLALATLGLQHRRLILATTPKPTNARKAVLPEFVKVGGRVNVGPVAFSVAQVVSLNLNAPAKFKGDGPFCARCHVRASVSRRDISLYSCFSPGCRDSSFHLMEDEVTLYRERAENLVEAACRRLKGEGKVPVVQPDLPLLSADPTPA